MIARIIHFYYLFADNSNVFSLIHLKSECAATPADPLTLLDYEAILSNQRML